MFDRMTLSGLAIAGLLVTLPAARCHAEAPAVSKLCFAMLSDDGEKTKSDKMENAADEKDGDKDDDKHEGKERHEEKEIEQAVPMNMIPQAILDAVKKELPNGTITEAELEAKKGRIVYAFDVKDGDMKYDVKITVEGKFFSKKVDDDKDESEEHAEKKPKAAVKK